MTLRHLFLALGALIVTIAVIHLAIEVRATPAAADVAARGTGPAASDDDDEPPAPRTASGEPSTASRSASLPTSNRPATTTSTATSAGVTPPAVPAEQPPDEKQIKQLVTDAYAAYDRQEFEDAKAIAAKVIEADPKHVRALRILVSTSCIESNVADAQKYFDMLPEGKDRADMRTRCGRDYGIVFK